MILTYSLAFGKLKGANEPLLDEQLKVQFGGQKSNGLRLWRRLLQKQQLECFDFFEIEICSKQWYTNYNSSSGNNRIWQL